MGLFIAYARTPIFCFGMLRVCLLNIEFRGTGGGAGTKLNLSLLPSGLVFGYKLLAKIKVVLIPLLLRCVRQDMCLWTSVPGFLFIWNLLKSTTCDCQRMFPMIVFMLGLFKYILHVIVSECFPWLYSCLACSNTYFCKARSSEIQQREISWREVRSSKAGHRRGRRRVQAVEGI